jgi:hypothetical protein
MSRPLGISPVFTFIAALLLVPLGACGDDDSGTTDDAGPPDAGPADGGSLCEPGARQCSGADVEECSADGSAWEVAETCGGGEACMDGACTEDYGIEALTADPAVIPEGADATVTLSASHRGMPSSHGWRQVGGAGGSGGSITVTDDGAEGATLEIPAMDVAGDTVLTFELSAEWDTPSSDPMTATDVETVEIVVQAVDLVPAQENGPIGGAANTATELAQGGNTFALFNKGGRLRAVQVGVTDAPVHTVDVGAYIHDIDVVDVDASQYALLSLGDEGIGVVDVTDVTAMSVLFRVGVNYEKLGVTFAEGGGAILTEDLAGVRSNIAALETDGTTLWIANADFGLQRTALTNLLATGGPVTETDGTLLIEAEQYTQQYAGEHAWGAPVSLTRFGGKLFAAQAFMGMGIFDATTLEQVGRYNMYVDTDVTEDWFIDMDVTTQVQDDAGDAFVDDFTGMPDYRQANFEIEQVWKSDVPAPTPWADFDRYGKYYYNSHDVAVADQGARTVAYIAYGLGGLVAVDVTGYDTATAGSFLVGDYLGYAPGVPAHGPDKPRMASTDSLYPYYGAGMLKEAGATSVAVDGTRVLYTDHFAGLVVLDHADDPATHWRQAGGPFDNDRAPGGGSPELGDHWPDYEWVTSYDMSPWDPDDHESLPDWMYEAPAVLTTGEIGGHGRALVLLSGADTSAAGGADLLMLQGAGGMNVLDLDFTGPAFADRFATVAYYPTTDEVGAAADGTATAAINMGHTQGITATGGYLYVADGPHGITAWDILDGDGLPIDDPHVVANTLQSEYPEDVEGTTVYPTPHAWGAILDGDGSTLNVMCQSLGLRRVSIASVEAGDGAVGSPVLIGPQPTDIFEHNGESGTVDGLQWQDHAYDVFRRGDLAFVADGSNGLTIYDVTQDPTDTSSGFVVGNVGGGSMRPPLGRATGVDLWTDEESGTDYAFVAAGQFGIGVVDVSDVTAPALVKVFQPIKIEDGEVGHADGRNVDVHVVGDHVYFSYTSFGVLSYTIADLIAPLPDGVDPTDIFSKGMTGDVEYDHRPEHVGRFKLTDVEGYEEYDAEALYMEYTLVADRLLFYIAYGGGGVVILDYTDPAVPALVAHAPTIHEATSVTLQNGRLYVADHDGGVAIFR